MWGSACSWLRAGGSWREPCRAGWAGQVGASVRALQSDPSRQTSLNVFSDASAPSFIKLVGQKRESLGRRDEDLCSHLLRPPGPGTAPGSCDPRVRCVACLVLTPPDLAAASGQDGGPALSSDTVQPVSCAQAEHVEARRHMLVAPPSAPGVHCACPCPPWLGAPGRRPSQGRGSRTAPCPVGAQGRDRVLL